MAYRFLAEDPAPCNFFRLRVCQIPFLLLVPGSLFFSLCMGWVCLFVFVWLVVGFFCIFFFLACSIFLGATLCIIMERENSIDDPETC